MDPDAPVDDNKYTVGIAASVCPLPLPVVYFVTRPLISISPAPWIPSLLSWLFILLPLFTAFTILYCHAWHPEWSQPKRIFLSVILSVVIFGADFVLLCFLVLEGVVLTNCLSVGG